MAPTLRAKLMVQTQAAEPESRAYCGLYSINNALQVYNFLSVNDMKSQLCELERKRPGEDHGCEVDGHYSMLAFQRTLRRRGYSLVHLNFAQFLYKKSEQDWARRIASSSFERLLIIGLPAGQSSNIYHCIDSLSDRFDSSLETPFLFPGAIFDLYTSVKIAEWQSTKPTSRPTKSRRNRRKTKPTKYRNSFGTYCNLRVDPHAVPQLVPA
jgi:hypothetical protein